MRDPASKRPSALKNIYSVISCFFNHVVVLTVKEPTRSFCREGSNTRRRFDSRRHSRSVLNIVLLKKELPIRWCLWQYYCGSSPVNIFVPCSFCTAGGGTRQVLSIDDNYDTNS